MKVSREQEGHKREAKEEYVDFQMGSEALLSEAVPQISANNNFWKPRLIASGHVIYKISLT